MKPRLTGQAISAMQGDGHDGRERVIHVLWHMDHGGAERAVYQLVREQRRRGVVADVLVGSSRGYYGSLLIDAGAEVYELGQRNVADVLAARRAQRIFSRYGIVHYHYPEPALIHFGARTDARLFYTHRAGVFRYALRQSARYRLAGRYFREQFAGVSANTRQGAEAASRLFGINIEDVAVTYNGIDFSLLTPTRSSAAVSASLGLRPMPRMVVGVTANLRAWKRIDRLLEALRLLNDSTVTCLVVGDGPDRTRLERVAAALDIEAQVVFTGTSERVGDYLQLLDVFVLPSGPEESFGNAAVEAMGVGVPAIVFSDGGGLCEHVVDGKCGYVVETTTQLARRLEELRDAPSLREALGAAARTHVTSRYSIDAMRGQYDAFYETNRTHELSQRIGAS
jgi:glycosyltransferase involved in cell wall biosynthesis